ncbi:MULTISPECIES: lipopolysaccharide biosynthesis protein [unclassified Ruminococcus]|uniref:lipopolysaccharide biosynthesis protein n=1 Tax=unclassified Ruminococcus TaxID=2608920 RepID=UPI002109F19B|nr:MULTISPECIES: oligosaccharide flippase family protein [unclassified Ruminococcus]MCQ4022546.1 oligosaccharide flippase family protein [Ruminococcus sp. zg-924]MCQ4114786.1 oligosaccharide flippase family protein [Ruminococcus sp. zg-921]
MSREGALAKNTAILAIGTFFPKFAIFITLPILTAFLTKNEYGTYDLVLTLVSLILPTATLQIQSAAFRYLIDVRHDEKEKKAIITNIYGFIIPVSAVALIIMWFFMYNLDLPVKLIITAYFFCDIISNANKQIIRGLSDNTAYAIGSIISALGQIILVLVLVLWLKEGLFGGIAAMCVAELLSSAYLLVKGHIFRYISIRELSFHRLKRLLSYSWPMVPNSLSQWIMHVSDRIIITFSMGLAANAVYAVAYKIPSILSFAQTTFNMAWQENATLVSKDDDVERYYSSMFATLFNIVAGCMAFLIGITPLLFKLLINGDYAEAYNQIPILYMGIFFYCLSAFWGGIYVAYKKTKIVATTTIAAALMNLVIDIVAINWIGLYAASISTLVSYIFLCIFRLISVQKFLKLKYDFKYIFVVLGILTVECILSFQQQFVLNIVNFVFGTAAFLFLNRKLISVVLNKVKKILDKK